MISIEPPSSDDLGVLTSELSKPGLTRFLNRARVVAGITGQVDVLLAGDGTLRRLNWQFRGKNKATDVLSFPALGVEEGGDARLAGDIAISLETAGRQAVTFGHSLRDEVRVLLVHGLLHLQGMDHETDQGEMARRESALRVELRLPGSLIARVEGGAGQETRTEKARVKADGGVSRNGESRLIPEIPEKIRATAKAKSRARTNAGVPPLRFASVGMTTVLGSVEKRATAPAPATNKAKAKATATAAARGGL